MKTQGELEALARRIVLALLSNDLFGALDDLPPGAVADRLDILSRYHELKRAGRPFAECTLRAREEWVLGLLEAEFGA